MSDRDGGKDELAPVPEEERLRRVQELEKEVPPAENDRVAEQLEGEDEETNPGAGP